MLTSLKIDNFALIPKSELTFYTGFSVLTGETGSGKSILLGALNLILGERADYSVIRDTEKKTIVEGIFNVANYGLKPFFEENDLDYSDEVFVRREITNQGKSRAFINDTPVQVQLLRSLSSKLIHIHSQHHTLELKNVSFQFDILDYLTDSFDLRSLFKTVFLDLKQLKQTLTDKKESLVKVLQEEDYIQFQLGELEKLNLAKVNFDALESELAQIEHFDTIQQTFQLIDSTLNSEKSAQFQLNQLKNQLEKNQQLHSFFKEAFERLVSINLELKDLAYEATSQQSDIVFSPERKFELEQQLSQFNIALMKHNVRNQQELNEVYANFKSQSAVSEDLKEEILGLEKLIASKTNELIQLGKQLDENRLAKKVKVEQAIQVVLADLKMDKSVIEFTLIPNSNPTEFGLSDLTLNFSPNIGLGLKPIDKVASGGELSRLMLAIQLLLSEKKQLPSMIFDEIDTGVSGEVAQKLGDLLNKMGRKIQLLAITHLPQVAAKGQTHYKVSKSTENDTTISKVVVLTNEEKVLEVARLMSGEAINEAAIQNARALMD